MTFHTPYLRLAATVALTLAYTHLDAAEARLLLAGAPAAYPPTRRLEQVRVGGDGGLE
jgi:hypothetical protein